MIRAALVCLLAATTGASAAILAAPLQMVARDGYLMGTRVALVTWAPTRPEGLRVLERALEAIESADGELSTWRTDSEVAALNRAPVGEPFALSAGLCRVLAALAQWHDLTAGAFDPAVGRLTELWDVHGSGRIPGSVALDGAAALSGFDRIGFDGARCTASRSADATLDVGAFGKGEALDRALAAAGGDGPLMIDLGGQIAVRGTPPRERGWPMAIADPRDRSRAFVEVSIPSGSLSTSAGSERDHHLGSTRVGHILDPRTGRPAPFQGSVSVWHDNALAADILSTALYVMGPEEGWRWAETRNVAACFLAPRPDADPEVLTTTAFRSRMIFFEVAAGQKHHEKN